MKYNQKACITTEKVIDRVKRSKTEAKPVENKSKNLQSFLEIKSRAKGSPSISQRNCQNQLSHPGLSHIEQECQESLIQGKIHNQQNLNEGLDYS